MPRNYFTIPIGTRFDRLAVAGQPFSVQGRNNRSYPCLCDCGKRVDVSGNALRGGKTRSCGCLRDAHAKAMGQVSRPRHGHLRGGKITPEYKAWCHLKERCLNPDHPSWPRYGGRGITVCDRWKDSFAAFFEDMGARPSDKHSIERVDNGGGYSPDNCVWATRDVQAVNRDTTSFHTLNGVTRTQSEWARLHGIPQCTISLRLKRGWSPEDALTRKPVLHDRHPLIEYRGERRSLHEWSKVLGMAYVTLHARYRRGWDIERMMTTPVQPRRSA